MLESWAYMAGEQGIYVYHGHGCGGRVSGREMGKRCVNIVTWYYTRKTFSLVGQVVPGPYRRPKNRKCNVFLRPHRSR